MKTGYIIQFSYLDPKTGASSPWLDKFYWSFDEKGALGVLEGYKRRNGDMNFRLIKRSLPPKLEYIEEVIE